MSIWQTKQWQEMLKQSGQTEKYFLVDGLYVEKRKTGGNNFGLFVIGCDFSQVHEKTINKLKDLSKKEKTLFVQLENIDYYATSFGLVGGLEKGYYKKFIMPYTAMINLEKSDEDILEEMKPKGRYNIRLAEKKGVEIIEATKNNKNIKIFFSLMQETTKRDSFAGNTEEYYTNLLNSIKESKLLFAKYQDEVIVAGIFIYYDDIAIYYYGASTSNSKYRNLMAPYLLQWKAIQIGKSKKCKLYDFLGIASPDEEDSHLKGVTDFKLKLTSDTRKVSDSYIYINKKLKYFAINLLKKLKK